MTSFSTLLTLLFLIPFILCNSLWVSHTSFSTPTIRSQDLLFLSSPWLWLEFIRFYSVGRSKIWLLRWLSMIQSHCGEGEASPSGQRQDHEDTHGSGWGLADISRIRVPRGIWQHCRVLVISSQHWPFTRRTNHFLSQLLWSMTHTRHGHITDHPHVTNRL